MAGRRDLERPRVRAVLETEIAGPEGKTVFARVRARRTSRGWVASSTGERSSNLLGTVARANGLAVVPPGVASLGPGEECTVILFRRVDD
jgi:molybdopterin molybdotransferase